MMLYVASTSWALTWLAVSFVATAGLLTYCVAYLNKGD